MNVPGYNPLRALQRFVELRSAARRSFALDFGHSRREAVVKDVGSGGATSEDPPANQSGAPADGLRCLNAGAAPERALDRRCCCASG